MSLLLERAEQMYTGLVLLLKLISSVMMSVPNALAYFGMTAGISCLLLAFSCCWISFLFCRSRKYFSKGAVNLNSGSLDIYVSSPAECQPK